MTVTASKFHRIKASKPAKTVVCECHRCCGSGIFGNHGQCWRCGGNGRDPRDRDWAYPADWTDEQCQAHADAREARNQAARERNARKRTAEALASLKANVELCPGLAQFFDPGTVICRVEEVHKAFGGCSMASKLIVDTVRSFTLSEKQVAVVAAAIARHEGFQARRAAEAALLVDVPAGRAEIEGEVLSIKHTEFEYRFGSALQTKILVKCNGFKVFGTAPASIVADVAKGSRVRFTATLQPKERGFGFFSRPTGGEIVG